jgi:glutamine cyclotransferase
MYDDQHVYSKPGQGWALSNDEKIAKAKEEATIKAGAPANSDLDESREGDAEAALMQHHRYSRDSFDRDPTSASMYDDQHVYSKPGEGWALSHDEKVAKAKEEATIKAGAPANSDLDESREGDAEAALM